MHRIPAFTTLALALAAAPAGAVPGDLVADHVLGQKNFVNAGPNFVESKGMNDPSSIAIDRTTTPNRIYVADFDNHRVLAWNNAGRFKKGTPADLVIGQADFNASFCNRGGAAAANTLCFPTGLAVDGDGDLYVADNFNHRVLMFEAPFASGMTANQSASEVFGQDSFTAGACNKSLGPTPNAPTAATLCGPAGVAVDPQGNVFVSDGFSVFFANHRVLEYDDPKAAGPGTPGTPGSDGDKTADRVYGQASFVAGGPLSACAATSASSLCNPTDLTVDAAGRLYVADTGRHRVVVYLNALGDGQTGAIADQVFGQIDLTGGNLGSGPGGLNFPTGVALDPAGNVWIADSFGHRVAEYDSPFTTDKLADRDFGTHPSFPSGRNFGSPADVDFDIFGNLYVADGMPPANLSGGYSRVLRLNDPLGTDKIADGVIGQKGYQTFLPNRVDGVGFLVGNSIAFDRSVSPPHVYVSDVGNNRVLGWDDASSFFDAQAADVVLGQPSFKAQQCNQGDFKPAAITLCNPFDVAVDAFGNVFVADQTNNRVVQYNRPFDSGMVANQPAARVYGQADFVSGAANRGANDPTASTLNTPRAVAIDGVGNLWVTDGSNFRVLLFKNPLADGAADLVLGQAGFTIDTPPSSATAETMLGPYDVFVDPQGNVFVTDLSYARLLVFRNPLAPGGGTPGTPGASGDRTADLVFGKANFTETGCNLLGGVLARTAQSLCGPNRLALDAGGRLWLADGSNHRVLRYDSALAGDNTADAVIGPPDFTTNGTACNGLRSASTFCTPHGVDIDPAGNLWIAENGSNRVLVFDATSSPAPAPPTCDGLVATQVGTDGDDVITGTKGNDVIVGLDGDDTIDGAGGNDVICGGNDDDTLIGGPGNDELFGQADDDELQGGAGNDALNGGAGTDTCDGGGGSNTTAQCP